MTMQPQRLVLFTLLFIAFEIALISFVDRPLSDYLRTVDAEHHGLIDAFRAYTDLGLSKWYLWPSGLGAILCALLIRMKSLSRSKRDQIRCWGERLFFLFAGVGVSGILSDILKPLIGRARPVLLLRDNIYGFHPFSTLGSNWKSLPSGHATTAFALALVLCYFFPRGRYLWLLFALSIAVSRVMVNAHFLADTIAGALLGSVTVILMHRRWERDGMFHLKQCIFPIDKGRGRA